MKNKSIKLIAMFAIASAMMTSARADEIFSYKNTQYEWKAGAQTLQETNAAKSISRLWDFRNNIVIEGQKTLPADENFDKLRNIKKKLIALLSEAVEEENIVSLPQASQRQGQNFFAGLRTSSP